MAKAKAIENWVKFQKETFDKPEVRKIAKLLGTHEVHAAAYCLAFWCYVDSHMRDGFVPFTDHDDIDGFAHCPGFAKALEAVGWARFADGGIHVPKPDLHLSQGAKGRAETTARQHNCRASKALQDGEPDGGVPLHPVTKSCDTLSQNNVTREEKRREDIKAAAGAESEADDDWLPVEDAAALTGVIYPRSLVKGAAKKGYTPKQALAIIRTFVEYRDEIGGPNFLHTRLTQQSPKLDRLDGWGKHKLKPRAAPAVTPLSVKEAQFWEEARKHAIPEGEIRQRWEAYVAKIGGTAA